MTAAKSEDESAQGAGTPSTEQVARVNRYEAFNGDFAYTSVITYCPGCKQAHPFRIEKSETSTLDIWEWDGNLEKPTFSPSLLCTGSVHICRDEHTYYECVAYATEGQTCDRAGHAIGRRLEDGTVLWEYDSQLLDHPKVFGHMSEHTQTPAWGNCHSFLRAGVWEFLTDSAHELAGQKVPMVPLPKWLRSERRYEKDV